MNDDQTDRLIETLEGLRKAVEKGCARLADAIIESGQNVTGAIEEETTAAHGRL